jgi:hypothetical protein
VAGYNDYPSKGDTCLYMYKAVGHEPHSFKILRINNCEIICTQEAIKVIEAIRNSFKVKTMVDEEKNFRCHIIDKSDKDGVWFHQLKLPKGVTAYFKEILGDTTRNNKIPSVPKH